MKITQITLLELDIPFVRDVSHALYSRSGTEAVIAVVADETGVLGYGEGTPRTYVTGESFSASCAAARQIAGRLEGLEIKSFPSLTGLLGELGGETLVRRHPAAMCAVELGCLDLWARRQGVPLWRLFRDELPQTAFTYSAVLPIVEEPERLAALIQLLKYLRPVHIKVKVANASRGSAVLSSLRETFGADVDLRVDANAAFSADEAIDFLEATRHLGLGSIEQPVLREDLDALKNVALRSPIPVIADESLYAGDGPDSFIEKRVCHGVNLRLSSCGGFLNTLRLWRSATDRGMIVQIGCHVGESAILSLAGRQLAALGDGRFHLEGSFSKYLLKADLVDDDISFGEKGRASMPSGPGLGITINPGSLHRWTRPVD